MDILICVYAAKHNDMAVEAAGKIAQATQGNVTALFVKPEPPERYKSWMDIPSGHNSKTIRELYQDLESVSQKIFDRVDSILGKYGVEAEKITVKGQPARAILSHTESRTYDLVIVGTTGLTGIQRTLVGSVSYQVAENANDPVLVIKKEPRFERLLICSDDSEDARRAEHMGSYLAKRLGMEVAILSVAPEGFPEGEAESCALRGREIAMEEGVEARTLCKTGKVRETILKEASGYDMVALGSRGLSKIKRIVTGHVSLHVVEYADSNVLVVRQCPLCGD